MSAHSKTQTQIKAWAVLAHGENRSARQKLSWNTNAMISMIQANAIKTIQVHLTWTWTSCLTSDNNL